MDQYAVLNIVGEGTYGVVAKCRHKLTGKVVAVKKFKSLQSSDYVRCTMLRELRVQQLLKGEPYVVQLQEAFKEQGRLFLVMEYVADSLLDVLDRHPQGLERESLRILLYTLVLGVLSCHNNGIIHRDIKPENILVKRDGTACLCDFGFCRPVTSSAEALRGGVASALNDLVLSGHRATMTDYVATRWYRSPEMLLGMPQYGYAVDMWAVGAIMAEAADGEPLLPGNTELEQLSFVQGRVGNFPPSYQTAIGKRSGGVVQLRAANPLAPAGRLSPENGEDRAGAASSYLRCRFLEKVGEDGVHLLGSLLTVNAATRISAKEAISHPFFDGLAASWGATGTPNDRRWAAEVDAVSASTEPPTDRTASTSPLESQGSFLKVASFSSMPVTPADNAALEARASSTENEETQRAASTSFSSTPRHSPDTKDAENLLQASPAPRAAEQAAPTVSSRSAETKMFSTFATGIKPAAERRHRSLDATIHNRSAMAPLGLPARKSNKSLSEGNSFTAGAPKPAARKSDPRPGDLSAASGRPAVQIASPTTRPRSLGRRSSRNSTPSCVSRGQTRASSPATSTSLAQSPSNGRFPSDASSAAAMLAGKKKEDDPKAPGGKRPVLGEVVSRQPVRVQRSAGKRSARTTRSSFAASPMSRGRQSQDDGFPVRGTVASLSPYGSPLLLKKVKPLRKKEKVTLLKEIESLNFAVPPPAATEVMQSPKEESATTPRDPAESSLTVEDLGDSSSHSCSFVADNGEEPEDRPCPAAGGAVTSSSYPSGGHVPSLFFRPSRPTPPATTACMKHVPLRPLTPPLVSVSPKKILTATGGETESPLLRRRQPHFLRTSTVSEASGNSDAGLGGGVGDVLKWEGGMKPPAPHLTAGEKDRGCTGAASLRTSSLLDSPEKARRKPYAAIFHQRQLSGQRVELSVSSDGLFLSRELPSDLCPRDQLGLPQDRNTVVAATPAGKSSLHHHHHSEDVVCVLEAADPPAARELSSEDAIRLSDVDESPLLSVTHTFGSGDRRPRLSVDELQRSGIAAATSVPLSAERHPRRGMLGGVIPASLPDGVSGGTTDGKGRHTVSYLLPREQRKKGRLLMLDDPPRGED